MVEKETSQVNISDTGVLSKEIEISCSDGKEVTDYWDISGAMETSPGSSNETSGNMKLENTADETLVDGSQDSTKNEPTLLDNVNTDSATAGISSNAMKTTYCENGPSAINIPEYGLKNNLNNNNRNQNGDDFVRKQGDCESKEFSDCKNSTITVDDTQCDNRESNAIPLQRESDMVGTDEARNKAVISDVNDIGSNNRESSGAKDNNDNADNKTETSIKDEMMLDSECTEERFRIDRKKLEQMLQAAVEGRGQSGEVFFQKIMDDTKTHITWPSKLKIGAKSKKDPHIRICGRPENIKEARQRIMVSLDTKSNRVTIKMDVSHTEHSHVIGKGGNNIKRVMQETGCHIHFPDSNRNNVAEKSNQVSITGHPDGVEKARTKIRSLLPIVLLFEIPNTGLPIPDPNSPMIQHLVQAYGISIQFKQRAKVYSTTCTIRGSSENIEGLKNGIHTLMNHVAGAQLTVTTQIEVAPQHHAYMLSKTGMNINTIIQSTGARIIFPDPNALPKKSTVYVNGSIDSVLLARHKLMGCLPLLLMFDTKAESNNVHQDVAHLMESLDLFINVKLKPKQPSKTVIIKSMEYNIYNMFEARAKLLGLEAVGIPRPTHVMSPKLNNTLSHKNAGGQVILLAPSHVSSPTVQTHVIGPSYVITHSVPSNPGTPRPLSTLSAVQTSSHSPFPNLGPQTGNFVSGLGSSPLISKEMLSREQIETLTNPRTQENMVNGNYTLVNNMSPPRGVALAQTSPLRPDLGGTYTVDRATTLQINQGQLNPHNNANQVNTNNFLRYGEKADNVPQNEDHIGYSPKQSSKQKLYQDFSRNVQTGDLNIETNRAMFPSNYDSTVPNRYSNKLPMQGNYQKNIHSLPNTFSPMLAKNENMHEINRGPMLSNNFGEPQSRYPHDVSGLQEEQMKRQHLDIGGQIGVNEGNVTSSRRTPVQPNNMNLPRSTSNSIMQTLAQNMYSPDSITGSRNSIGSERNSPMSSISDRFIDSANSRLSGYDQYDDKDRHGTQSPGNQSNAYQPLANRDLNSLSPLSARSHSQQLQRSPPQIVLSHQNGNNQYESSDISQLNDTGKDVADMYNKQNDITSGPPPGFEGFTPAGQAPVNKTDYHLLRRMAEKAMESKLVNTEERTPTDMWSGCGFSKSMPFQMKEDLKKVAARFRSNLPTTFENSDTNPDRDQPSPVNEEDEDTLDSHFNSHLRVPMSYNAGNAGKGSSLKAWRRKNVVNMNLSLGGHVGLNFMGGMQRRPPNHSAFTPVHANESLNESSSPQANKPNESLSHTRPVINSPFNKSGNERTLSYPRPENPIYESRVNMSSTPTIQDSLGLNIASGTKSKVEADISDVLNRLDLGKYVSVFQQQEVDFQTFLTLTEPDLKELGISTFGPRKKILLAIKDLNKDRDVFSGPSSNDTVVHENISDQMLQLQRLQLQQHRDNPQTTNSTNLDSHSLLSPPRKPFSSPSHQNHLDVPASNMERRGVFHEEPGRANMGNERMRPMNSSRLWQNSRAGISNSGHW